VLPARSDLDKRPSHGISMSYRVTLLAAGLASWGAGGVASFVSGNGAGAAALVAVGALCGGVALIGRWPSRISMSGNELTCSTVAVFRWVAVLPLCVMFVRRMLLHSVTFFLAVAGYPVAAARSRPL
jgi:hypothetical protein